MHGRPARLLAWLAALALGAAATQAAWAITEGRTAQGRAYVSGGVALGEREALDRERASHSLWVATAVKRSGSYLSDVRVRIHDSAGTTVLDTKLDGPWLLVTLGLGRYEVEASFAGQTQKKTTTIHPDDRHEMLFYFDLEVERLPEGVKG